MFQKNIEKFKKDIENEMKNFFNMTPVEISDEIVKLKEEYGTFCDLDKDSLYETGMFSKDYQEILLRYKTLVYFQSIYAKIVELEDFFNKGIEL